MSINQVIVPHSVDAWQQGISRVVLICVVVSTILFTAKIGHTASDADHDGDGITDALDLDQDNDGLTNWVEGYRLVTDPAVFPANDYLPLAVETPSGSQSQGAFFRYQLTDNASAGIHWFQADFQSGTATLNWFSHQNLPKLQLEKPGIATIRWTLLSADTSVAESINIDLTISDLDAERSETIIVAKDSIIGYSLASASIIAVTADDNGQLTFAAILGNGGQADSGSVTLHVRDQSDLVIGYRSSSNINSVAGLNNDRAGFRHQFSDSTPVEYIPVASSRDTDLDGTPDHRDLDSDDDGVSDVIEALGTDADTDGRADGIVNSGGIPATAGNGLVAPDINQNGVADPFDFAINVAPVAALVVAAEPTASLPSVVNNDNDNDGLSNSQEQQLGTDPDNPDTDGDGNTDSEEVMIFHTDPLLSAAEPDIAASVEMSDADNDGIADSLETIADQDNDGVPNQFDLDSDNDGIADIIESGREDANADGQLDSSGIALIQNTLDLPDYDRDGIANMFDLDSDQDGVYDITEVNGTDIDKNGVVDILTDANGDGWADNYPGAVFIVIDSDQDGDEDYLDATNSIDLILQNDDVTDTVPGNNNPPLQTGLRGAGGCALIETTGVASSRDISLWLLLLMAVCKVWWRARSKVGPSCLHH